jgi:meiotically up-regulated gene 157 (Mug157) protein
MRALTSHDPEEVDKLVRFGTYMFQINRQIDMLETSTAGQLVMHESFSVHDPSSYTRSWFAWANSLFSELILKKLDVIEPRK